MPPKATVTHAKSIIFIPYEQNKIVGKQFTTSHDWNRAVNFGPVDTQGIAPKGSLVQREFSTYTIIISRDIYWPKQLI